MRYRRGLLRRRPHGDGGFSLMESVVALSIAAVVFMALGVAAVSTFVSTLGAQQNQQAGDALNQRVEALRALSYDALVMKTSDLAVGESAPHDVSTCTCYDPLADIVTGTGTEPLAVATAGTVSPHVSTVVQNGLTYTLRTYITLPADAVSDATVKRITVVASWTTRGKPHTRSMSTVVSDEQRGLPLPNYNFSNPGATACTGPGGTITLVFKIVNNGATESYKISTTDTNTWAYAQDVAPLDGVYDAGVDTDLATTGNAATVGPLAPYATATVFARTTPAAAGSAGFTAEPESWALNNPSTATKYDQGPLVAAWTVQSPCPAGGGGGSPTPTPSSGASASPTPTAIAPPQPTSTCAAPTPVPTAVGGSSSVNTAYSLHNGATNVTNTTATAQLPMTGTAPSSTTLWDYATDVAANVAGRTVGGLPAGSATESRPAYVSEWRYSFAAKTKVSGQVTLTMWVAPTAGSTQQLALQGYLDDISSGGSRTNVISGATSPAAIGCAGFVPLTVTFQLGSSGYTFPAGDSVAVRLENVSAAASVFAYDTTTFTSSLVLPQG